MRDHRDPPEKPLGRPPPLEDDNWPPYDPRRASSALLAICFAAVLLLVVGVVAFWLVFR